MFSCYLTPEGFILPKSIFGDQGIMYQIADDEEMKEIERFQELQQNKLREKEARRQARIKEKREERKNRNQLSLFDDLK